MSDLIDRQSAIDALCDNVQAVCPHYPCKQYIAIENLPSAQPERLTDDDFETIRIHLSACKERLCNQHRWKEAEEYQRIIDRFMAFASEQPEPEELDFVQPHKKIDVRLEIGQPKPQWIPCSERLPEIGKEVLLSEPNIMFIAEYHGSGDPEGLWLVDGCHHYLADVNGCAWMPLPEPYKERRGE